jgi:hypothetical protein
VLASESDFFVSEFQLLPLPSNPRGGNKQSHLVTVARTLSAHKINKTNYLIRERTQSYLASEFSFVRLHIQQGNFFLNVGNCPLGNYRQSANIQS